MSSELLPTDRFEAGTVGDAPVDNAAFFPDRAAMAAPAFCGLLRVHAAAMRTLPILEPAVINGRDARIFPGVELELFTLGDLLVPVQRGTMVRETLGGLTASYWCLIPQLGRVWRKPADHGWSRAALPVMLVNDTENHAHQGLASFLYRDDQVTGVVLQFIQQTGPYLIKQYFIAWGFAHADRLPGDASLLEARRSQVRVELAQRLPAKPWSELLKRVPGGTLDGFGGPLYPTWRVAGALLLDGTLYYLPPDTPYGPYPYPLEMRYGVRSVTKSVFAPLSLLHLAQDYGARVFSLRIGDYVPGLDPKWKRVRFIDAANMVTGFGGVGSTCIQPNDILDGYLAGNYDAWYTAASMADKIHQINSSLCPYPWEPGTVMRYRDQDYFLLGMALDAFLKSMRGRSADLGEMLRVEVFEPLGIHRVPLIRTREAGGAGVVWCNAGYYPTLDDLAKIAMLYQSGGAHGGKQILSRELTCELLQACDAIVKSADSGLYKLGFHFLPPDNLPTMRGAGGNEVILHPSGLVSIVIAKASAEVLASANTHSDDAAATVGALRRLASLKNRIDA